jgi:hypothetical protein
VMVRMRKDPGFEQLLTLSSHNKAHYSQVRSCSPSCEDNFADSVNRRASAKKVKIKKRFERSSKRNNLTFF